MANNELVINATEANVEIALMQDRKLVEIHKQESNNKEAVGDIFVASIKKLMPGLNAAFLDIGHRKDAFLHYTDLGPQIKSLLKFTKGSIYGNLNTHTLDNFDMEPDNPKNGKIQDVFQKNYKILVQILKEPISTKGPRLSCEITIPGRYMVMSPFTKGIAVSKKISDPDERQRLKNLAESIKPKNFGLILRTAAEGKKVAELHDEVRNLMGKWEKLFKSLNEDSNPGRLISEVDKTSGLIRDILNNNFNKIIVNDKVVHDNVKEYLQKISPEQVRIVSQYRGKKPIYDHFGVTRQIKSSFGKTSTMPSGAYIVIEHTEAMHVIDVNSGPKSKRIEQETAAIQVNLEAAKEIARQLRLRDIGGLIIIDFIDMRNPKNKSELYKEMKEAMKDDRAQHTILPLSKFGLMQITRQRARPEVKIDTSETCSSCKGTGKVNATILIEDEIERDLEQIINSRPKSKIKLELHPYLYSYFKQGMFFKSKRYQWYKKYMKWITLIQNHDYSINNYVFYDQNNDEIRLN